MCRESTGGVVVTAITSSVRDIERWGNGLGEREELVVHLWLRGIWNARVTFGGEV